MCDERHVVTLDAKQVGGVTWRNPLIKHGENKCRTGQHVIVGAAVATTAAAAAAVVVVVVVVVVPVVW
ncbi:hypothetical protein ElyMa_000089000 [Elysia marginata]|uniref:Uncharacterized protein n=1 Tax=Elysia marginata TaxID=1093978 RepID=A0AAV4EK16_9GAST|nr:hypothetical protein ElyMa_000089000 [Elysia marginata]